METLVKHYAEALRVAAERKLPLRLRAGGSKDFYGEAGDPASQILDVSGHKGIVDYEPSELVISARAGTPLTEIERALAERGQMLAFEPPHFGPHATLGGCMAAGLSGPRRAAAGALRDFVLGVRLLDGRGADLRFGGRVMKNVAGYDVSRLMAGAMGTLGLLLEITLKVLPRPAQETTLRFVCSEAEAITRMNACAARPLPVTASAWHGGQLKLRLSGSEAAVRDAAAALGGEALNETEGSDFWTALREHGLDGMQDTLWRVSLASAAAPLNLPGRQWLEWNGALRWLAVGEGQAAAVRAAAAAHGGHATLFRAKRDDRGGVPVFHPLPAPLMAWHRNLKQAFDPAGILNRGRLYPGL